jgi:hypothetical protein
MTTVQITVSDALARDLDRAGLFDPEKFEGLVREGLRAQAVARLKAMRALAAADSEPPMTSEKVQAEINAYRAEKRLAAGT